MFLNIRPLRIDQAPVARVNKVRTKILDRVGNLARAARQRGSDRRGAFAAIHCSQRFHPMLGSRNDSLATRTQCPRKQPVDPFLRKIRQVAGDD